MVEIYIGISTVILLVGVGFFVNHMENLADKRKEKRLEEFYNDDDDWWNDV